MVLQFLTRSFLRTVLRDVYCLQLLAVLGQGTLPDWIKQEGTRLSFLWAAICGEKCGSFIVDLMQSLPTSNSFCSYRVMHNIANNPGLLRLWSSPPSAPRCASMRPLGCLCVDLLPEHWSLWSSVLSSHCPSGSYGSASHFTQEETKVDRCWLTHLRP